MATQRERAGLTYDDYRQLPDDRNRYELFEGELQVTPAPGTIHQIVVSKLFLALGPHVRRRRLGLVLVAPCDVLLSATTVVQPDLLFVAGERREIVLPAYVKGPPDLVVEVVSPLTARRDFGEKRELYARFGVPFYWLVDPQSLEANADALQDGVYRRVASARADETFSAPPFPELRRRLGEVWTW